MRESRGFSNAAFARAQNCKSGSKNLRAVGTWNPQITGPSLRVSSRGRRGVGGGGGGEGGEGGRGGGVRGRK